MKIKMKFGYSVYILLGIIVALTLASSVINVLILTGAGNFVKGNVAVTSVSLACSILLFVLCLILLFASGYVFMDKQLVAQYGILRLKYPYDDIIAVAVDELTKKLYLQLRDEKAKDGFSIIAINIDSKFNTDFILSLLDKNPNIKHKDNKSQSDDTEG